MLMLAEIVAASREVGLTRSRKQKTERIARTLRLLKQEEVRAAVGFLCGELRQGKIGIGQAALGRARSLPEAGGAEVTVLELDAAFDALYRLSGRGSVRERDNLLSTLFERLTAQERNFTLRLILGDLRQGALEAVVLAGLAEASGVSSNSIRRAMLFLGDAAEVAFRTLTGGEAALSQLTIQLFRALRPMLAQSAKDVDDAFQRTAPSAFEQKLDGARIQVHREKERVAIYSRNGNDVTDSLPEVVELVRSLPGVSAVLDGEAVALDSNGRPLPFQVTMRRFGRKLEVAALRQELPLSAFFFDCLYLNGEVLVEQPNTRRWAALCEAVPISARVVRCEVASASEGSAMLSEALRQGHEGVVAKSLASSYEAGRRRAGWLKVKPAPTLDLVVLAAEWGSGKRQGMLSNLHLGARDPETGGLVMLGKTFKGLTDELLAWQTLKLQKIATERDDHVVHVRPELVVEIAFDGLQRSPHYPGGLALRFARVRRYREDKPASEADTIGFVRSLYERSLGKPTS